MFTLNVDTLVVGGSKPLDEHTLWSVRQNLPLILECVWFVDNIASKLKIPSSILSMSLKLMISPY